jgi:hypothetical protein
MCGAVFPLTPALHRTVRRLQQAVAAAVMLGVGAAFPAMAQTPDPAPAPQKQVTAVRVPNLWITIDGRM